jgi:hypothetical protein
MTVNTQSLIPIPRWDGWADDQLRDYEQRLFDDEMRGESTWELREEILDEMRRRDLI